MSDISPSNLSLENLQELTRLIRALHTLAEKQLIVSLDDRNDILAKKQILLDELSKRNISETIIMALESSDNNYRQEAAQQIEFLNAIEKMEAITLEKWYQECESSMKNMQDSSNNQQFKSQYKGIANPSASRFLDDKR
jgi:hypothetical protein